MTTKKNDGKNARIPGSSLRYIDATYAKQSGMNDNEGIPFHEYELTVPELNPGDSFLRTVIDVEQHKVLHVAIVVRSKTECSGQYVMYVYTRRGLLVHRVPATDEVIHAVTTRLDKLSMKAEHGPLDHHPGLVAKTAERLRMEPQPGSLLEKIVTKHGDGIYAVGTTARQILVNRDAIGLLEMFEEGGITLEEAATITGLSDPKEKVEAMEKWLNTHGGMTRINEDTLSRVLFGPVPGSRERVLQADLEVAKSKCVEIVRPNRHGKDIGYGLLAVSRINGIPFLCDVYALEQLGLPAMHISKVPPFQQDIQLHINFINALGQDSHAVVYALEKEDLNPLGLLLSSPNRRVAASFMAAHLKIWIDGIVEREYTSPEEFFACTPEWIEQAKF